jgi:hypothetical protein
VAEACGGGGDALIRYVPGAGFKADGYFCSPDPATYACYTDVVVYDGTGLKRFTEDVAYMGYCTGGTFVDYDGTGLKPVSQARLLCIIE